MYNDIESRRENVKQRDDNVLKKHYTRKNNINLPALNIKQLKNRYEDLGGSLRIFHQNIRGIKGKLNEFMIHIATMLPGIICLTEHHLTYNGCHLS
jgi:archaellum component FlaC